MRIKTLLQSFPHKGLVCPHPSWCAGKSNHQGSHTAPWLLDHRPLQPGIRAKEKRGCGALIQVEAAFSLLCGRGVVRTQEVCVEAPCSFCSALTEHALTLSRLYLYDRDKNELLCLFQEGNTTASLSTQAVTFQFMLSVYSVLALRFMINLKELDHTLSRSSKGTSVDC